MKNYNNSEDQRECYKCKKIKPIDEFHKDEKHDATGYSYQCKECKKQYYLLNKEKYALRHNIRRQTKPEEIKKTGANYRKNNKSKIKKYLKEYYDKNINIPLFRLKITIRSRIYYSIKNKGYLKNKSTLEILCCSNEELQKWLSQHFSEGMTVDNLGNGEGKWNIDHGIPVSWARNEKELIELNKFTNLKPMWDLDNKSKRNYFGEQWNGKEWIKISKEDYYKNNPII